MKILYDAGGNAIRAIPEESDETIAASADKDLGKAAMTIDAVRYEGRLVGGGDFFRFIGQDEQGGDLVVGLSASEILPDAGSYPWRIELKPRPGIWEKAILAYISRGVGKET